MIIIYGGAFNPPTKAHYLIAKELIEKKVLNKEDIGNIYNDYLSQKHNKKDSGGTFLQ